MKSFPFGSEENFNIIRVLLVIAMRGKEKYIPVQESLLVFITINRTKCQHFLTLRLFPGHHTPKFVFKLNFVLQNIYIHNFTEDSPLQYSQFLPLQLTT